MTNVARTTLAPDRQWDRRSDTAGRGMLSMVVLLFIERNFKIVLESCRSSCGSMAALLGLVAATLATVNAAPLRVMFVGNSFTFVNDLPQQLQHIASSRGVTIDVCMDGCVWMDTHEHIATC
jgi:hypothetical protein